jgi:mycothiol synthase
MMYVGSLSITNPSPRDWTKFQSFFRYAYHMKGEIWQGGSPVVKNALGRSNYSLDKDLFIAELNRRIVGVADVATELRIARSIIEWFVHPAVQRKKIGRELVKYAIDRGRQQGAKVAHICSPEEDKFARNFAGELGFSQARCFLSMEAVLTGSHEKISEPVPVEHFHAGDAALLTTVQNRIFTGSWGFCPNSPDDIRYYFRLTQSKWQDILLIRENAKIIGYCWLHPVIREGRPLEKRKWRLHMFGIDPEFQGKGWGKILFHACREHLRKREASSLELTVDNENTPAIQLYKSMGFRVKSREFWYEKILV